MRIPAPLIFLLGVTLAAVGVVLVQDLRQLDTASGDGLAVVCTAEGDECWQEGDGVKPPTPDTGCARGGSTGVWHFEFLGDPSLGGVYFCGERD